MTLVSKHKHQHQKINILDIDFVAGKAYTIYDKEAQRSVGTSAAMVGNPLIIEDTELVR